MVYVENVTIRDVGSAEELFGLLDEVRRPLPSPTPVTSVALNGPPSPVPGGQGNDRRHVAETKMNATSSRSHSVASILLDVTNKHSGVGSLGKLTLVDLAGARRAGHGPCFPLH